MSEQPTDSYWSRVAICVAAAEGEAEALAQVAASARLNPLACALRLGPALALAADQLGVESPVEWRRHLQLATTAWLVMDRTVASVSDALGAAGVLWVPIKGFDVGTRFHQPREQRPTSDLDILVRIDDVPQVRRSLESVSWSSLEVGRRLERYLREEGYAWQATDSAGGMLEVHFRLWGLVPDGLAPELLETARPDAALGECGRRIEPAHAFVLAAVHGWAQDSPRSLGDWRDVEKITRSGRPEIVGEVVSAARKWSLELPVALSAMVVERIWSSTVCREILATLTPDLRGIERRLLPLLSREGIDAVAWRRIVWARLVAGRPSRAGWRTVWRQVWAHPGEVERATPEDWSWPRRRLQHLGRSLHRSRRRQSSEVVTRRH